MTSEERRLVTYKLGDSLEWVAVGAFILLCVVSCNQCEDGKLRREIERQKAGITNGK